MNRAEKTASIESLQQDMGRASLAVVAEFRGLTAGQMNNLRAAVRKVDGRFRVAKNTLAKRAVSGGTNDGMTALMRGPVAMILAFDDPVAVAKVAVKFAEELPKLEIRGAVLDGQVLKSEGVKALADLPPREVILAQLLGLLQAPATHLVRLLNEPASRVARLVDAVAKQREGQ
jgi:large subunit ribosomal protein L10